MKHEYYEGKAILDSIKGCEPSEENINSVKMAVDLIESCFCSVEIKPTFFNPPCWDIQRRLENE